MKSSSSSAAKPKLLLQDHDYETFFAAVALRDPHCQGSRKIGHFNLAFDNRTATPMQIAQV